MAMLAANTRPNPNISTYHGTLDVVELIDWINEMEKLFKCEETHR